MPRDEHSAVLDEPNSQMVIFGGFQDGERTNEVAIYNLKTNVWQKVKLSDNAKRPCARSGHSAVVHNGVMYIFGGKAENSIKLNDLWGFNLQTQTWSKITPVDDVVPDTRSGHSSCIYDGLIMVFGGIFEVTKELNDVCAFSISQKRWVILCQEVASPSKLKKSSTIQGDASHFPQKTETPYKNMNTGTDIIATPAVK